MTSVNNKKLEKRLKRNVGKAIADFNMIEEGDRVMVCISGGKDSLSLLDILMKLQAYAPIRFEIIAVHLAQGQPGVDTNALPTHFKNIDVNYHIIQSDTYSIISEKIPATQTRCSLCSRLRRGHLYAYARENNIDKIALGHHMDDMMTTLFLNMFHGGKLATMPPKLLSDDKSNILIRPLAYCREKDIIKYAQNNILPVQPCGECGTPVEMQERESIKQMLWDWEKTNPHRITNIINSIKNINPSHMLDTELYDFKNLKLSRK